MPRDNHRGRKSPHYSRISGPLLPNPDFVLPSAPQGGKVSAMDWLLYVLVALFWPSSEPAAPPGQTVTIPIDPPGSDDQGPLPTVTAARGENPPLVVIDAGHGGEDPGAESPFTDRREKDVTLAIALAVRDALAASGRVRVAMTREDDRFLVLEDRYRIARRLDADLFISIHADAAPENDQARGATVYTLSEVASDQEAALLARRQNASNQVGGARMSPDPNVNLILIDLAQRESMNVSAEFARLLYREAAPVFPFRPDWHKFAAFIVLKAPDIPSILFESGYLTNETDTAYIESAQGRREIAEGMRRAVESHFARRGLRRGA